MRTVAISLRLPKDEVGDLDKAARQTRMDRPAFLKQALRRGVRDMMLEEACAAYRQGGVTLSRAAEMAGLTLRDMIQRMRQQGLDLNYAVEDLDKDLQA